MTLPVLLNHGWIKMNNLFLILFFLFPTWINAQMDADTPLQFEFAESENNLTGCYTSYYFNGKIRATGNLSNGFRTGVWELHDSLGTTLAIREYLKPNCYRMLYPAATDKEPKGFCSEQNNEFHERGIILHIQFNKYIPSINNKTTLNRETQQCIYNALMLIPGLNEENGDFNDTLQTLDCKKHRLKKRVKLTGIQLVQNYYWDRGAREGIIENQHVNFIFRESKTKKNTFTSNYKSIERFMKQIRCNGKYKYLSIHDFIAGYYGEDLEYKQSIKLSKHILDYIGSDEISEKSKHLFFLLEAEHDLWVKYQ
jgi:hypothetical protein